MSATATFQARAGGASKFSPGKWRLALAFAILLMCFAAVAGALAQDAFAAATSNYTAHVAFSAAKYDKYCTLKQYGAPEKEYAPLLNSMIGLKVVEFRKFADGQFQTKPYTGNPVPCDGWYPTYDRSDDLAAIKSATTEFHGAWLLFAVAALTSGLCLMRLSRKD